jgi:hypothetical protein
MRQYAGIYPSLSGQKPVQQTTVNAVSKKKKAVNASTSCPCPHIKRLDRNAVSNSHHLLGFRGSASHLPTPTLSDRAVPAEFHPLPWHGRCKSSPQWTPPRAASARSRPTSARRRPLRGPASPPIPPPPSTPTVRPCFSQATVDTPVGWGIVICDGFQLPSDLSLSHLRTAMVLTVVLERWFRFRI